MEKQVKKKEITYDYKDLSSLKKFISEKGKITPRRITYISIKKQKDLSNAIKRARYLALLPYKGRQMEIILLESLNKLGKAGEIVSVKDGFAKNYLIPQKKAIIANKKNKSNLETKIEQINQVNIKKISNAKLLKEKIDGKNITIEMEANDDGGLYGAITQKIIADEITSSQNVDISPDSIIIGPIRELGEHQIQVRIYEDVISKIILTVSKKS